MLNVYSGTVTTNRDGVARVRLPAYFGALNRDFRYQLTVIGEFARAMVSEEIKDNEFAIRTDPGRVKVCWQVTGVRKDAWAEANRIPVEETKPKAERGRYLHPELFGKKAGAIHPVPAPRVPDALPEKLRGRAEKTLWLELRGQAISGGARYLSAGRGITMPEPGRTTVPYWVTSEAEGRKAVEELAAHKVDIVKIWVDTRDGKYKKLTPEIYGAIIDEAHKRGLRVTAHIFELEDAKGLIRARIDAFAHGVRDRDVDDELLAMLKQRPDLVVTPNLPDRGVKVDLGWLRAGLPPEEFAKLEVANTDQPAAQGVHAIQARNLARMDAAGVRLTLGTDGNRPWGPHEEMLDMVLAGMTPMQVIVAATRNSAEFLRLADIGTLDAGKSADFLVLDANPLDDITNTRRIAAVILRGATVDRSQPVR
jgi:Amidohydrolase family